VGAYRGGPIFTLFSGSEFEIRPSAPTNAPDFKRRLRCTWLQGKGGVPSGYCITFYSRGLKAMNLRGWYFRVPDRRSDELVAFWHDGRHWDYDEVDFASTPIVGPIRV
jgi:hypothetical protein